MPNPTVSIDEPLLRAAKVYAARHGTSISRIVRDHLAEVTGLASGPAGDDLLARYRGARSGAGRSCGRSGWTTARSST
jgi:plasmid stability protein